MDLRNIRARIDNIDHALLDLFCQRMDIAAEVAASKIEVDKAVFDPVREREKLIDIASRTPEHLRHQAIALFSLLMSMNKAEQQRIIAAARPDSRSRRTRDALESTGDPFPATATVACQGVEGAYSQIAACKLFRVPAITFCDTFEGVFKAVAESRCTFGVLPIENSTAGSVNAVYDQLSAYSCYICRSLRLKVEHNLLAVPGTTRSKIREVYSHEQALAQCADYLEALGTRTHVLANTAEAAEFVASADRHDIAALSSRSCASLYGLKVLEADVQDSDNNYTRFIVIAATPKVYPGANRTSLKLRLPHEPGSLYRVLERIYALDVNLVKLESRPIPGHDFEFMFYFDLDCPVPSPAHDTLLDSLDDVCESVTYLGSYTEVL